MAFNTEIPIRKSWGQNFLIDKNTIKKILTAICAESNEEIIEIGPGRGALTIPLSKLCKKIYAIEIDPLLVNYLDNKNIKNITLYNKDILKWNPESKTHQYKIIGNLPYNISSPIIFKFLKEPYWNKMIIMVQKEMGERIIAKPNCKDYSRISVMAQTFCNIKKEFNISNNVFYPKPEIQSSILTFTKKHINLNFDDFSLLIRLAFRQRRKKLKNNLINLTNSPILRKYSENRPENISVEDYLEIFNNYIF